MAGCFFLAVIWAFTTAPATLHPLASAKEDRKQFALLMSLKPDSALITRYKAYHRQVWPEVESAFRKAGILDLKIFLFGCQTFLLVETTSSFNADKDFDKISGPAVDQWDKLMSNFQQITGHEKWVPVELIYHMNSPMKSE